jgi:beta-lactam-binding protein with PASTA domain
MGLVGRTLGGCIALTCAASLSGGSAVPALERALTPAPDASKLTSLSTPEDVPPELQSPSTDVRVSVTEVEAEVDVEIFDAAGSVVGGGSFGPTNSSIASGSTGIPAMVLAAYQSAAERIGIDDSGCGLRWQVLAGIGKIESSHARGGQLNAAGVTVPRIIGPVLNGGPGVAAISDSDDGVWDGDSVWDRAVGPMQFIPGTWRGFGADADGDGVADPHNVWDAALSAGHYLCAGGGNLSTLGGLQAALFRYNHSLSYVNHVMSWINAYLDGEPEPTPDRGPGAAQAEPGDEPARVPEKPKVPGPEEPEDPDDPPDPPGEPPDPNLVAVPALVGLVLAEAQAALKELGMVAVVAEQETAEEGQVGRVIAQSPEAAAELAAGAEVTLTVGVAPPPVVVPELVGLTLAEAEAKLTDLGLDVVVVEQEVADEALVGQVLSQEPGALAEVEPGAQVTLTVGVAPPPVVVPELVGMALADAEAALTDLGLDVVVVEQVVEDEAQVGQVLAQDPGALAEVEPGAQVTLTVGVAPPPPGLPEVVGMALADAEEALTDLGLDVVVVEQVVEDEALVGQVLAQEPEAATEIVAGDEVTLTVGVSP